MELVQTPFLILHLREYHYAQELNPQKKHLDPLLGKAKTRRKRKKHASLVSKVSKQKGAN
jgi:hypothetical protein